MILIVTLGVNLGANDEVVSSLGQIGLAALVITVLAMACYSLAPTLLAPSSLSVSAVAFRSNVMREIFAIITIPIVAKYVG